jgi:complex iron-sulfur molybdoenzyme family reductase subunit gamma
MQYFTKIVTIAVLLCSVAMASSISAVKVSGDVTKITPNSKAWRAGKFSEIYLYPQTTIKFHDKKANELNADRKSLKIDVAALYDGKNIAIKVIWPDDTKNVQNQTDTDSYADGFAIQFANKLEDVNKLPYIGMGSKGRDVTVVIQKATDTIYEPNGKGDISLQLDSSNLNYFGKSLDVFNKQVESVGNNDYQRVFVAEGFRSMTQIKDNSVNFNSVMKYKSKKKIWSGTVTKTLIDEYADLNKDAFAIAIATWDGDKNNRDGIKMLSSWISVNLIKGETELSKITDEVVEGDPIRGKLIADDNGCSSCHRYADQQSAPQWMAPNLKNIGGYATASYLRESLNEPSAVVVAGFNRNSHPSTPWYTLDEDGNRVSTMTSYELLSEEDKTDLIAYLQTLKVESE